MTDIIKSRVLIDFETSTGLSSSENIGPRNDDTPLRAGLRSLVQALLIDGQQNAVLDIVEQEIAAQQGDIYADNEGDE